MRHRFVIATSCALAAVIAAGSLAVRANEPAKPEQTASAAPETTVQPDLPAIAMPTTAPTLATEPPSPAAAAEPPRQPEIAAPAAAVALSPLAAEIQKRIGALPATAGTATERAAIAKVYAATDHAPRWVSAEGLTKAGKAIASEFAQADDWGLSSSDYAMPAIGAGRDNATLADSEVRIALAALKYARDARGGRFDPTQLSNYIDRKGTPADPAQVLADLAASAEPDGVLRALHPQHPQFKWLRKAYIDARAGRVPVEAPAADAASKKTAKAPAAASTSAAKRILANMEQWRWMPETLGDTYVWVNIPEFTLRVVKNGKIVHSERVIAGKVDTQTPIFSDQMETVVFHPIWGVPDSIKVKEILPGLARGGGGVLAKNNLKMSYKGRDVDPQTIDWATTDIRNLHVYQPPGTANVLGVVKFLFPNKHQVYMHDTPTKSLFNAALRTFSHGCMRVRDPLKLAEVILGEDKGWTKDRIASLAAPGAAQNSHVTLSRKIPVHVTYFTAFVDDAGVAQFRSDVYGHEPRIQMGLEGKAHLIVRKKEDLTPVRAEVVSRLVEARQRPTNQNWIKQIFGF